MYGLHTYGTQTVVKPYEQRDVTYSAAHSDPQIEEAYVRYKSDVFDANKVSNLKNQGLSGNTDARRVKQSIPMPDYMAEQMPELMPKVMDNLMPHMINDVVPLVTQPMIDYLKKHAPEL